tara:strand:+ start:4302 stop:4703 length:402 start_codon:yes stop_codon:yes gene_type:complete
VVGVAQLLTRSRVKKILPTKKESKSPPKRRRIFCILFCSVLRLLVGRSELFVITMSSDKGKKKGGKVKLESGDPDKREFEVSREVAEMSITVKNMLEGICVNCSSTIYQQLPCYLRTGVKCRCPLVKKIRFEF